ncbi:hypothetical protein EJ02DRAFT_432025 [Clathrospora elynae]|uniref:Uncharacterized protein n=1 Tax=Clathrospora elynae TaxID=706981 RepID=A0A6A5SXD5_9PLEO|nr:hypothetical protein EJ02DRAFT_432025 [Clathrospora elynae]
MGINTLPPTTPYRNDVVWIEIYWKATLNSPEQVEIVGPFAHSENLKQVNLEVPQRGFLAQEADLLVLNNPNVLGICLRTEHSSGIADAIRADAPVALDLYTVREILVHTTATTSSWRVNTQRTFLEHAAAKTYADHVHRSGSGIAGATSVYYEVETIRGSVFRYVFLETEDAIKIVVLSLHHSFGKLGYPGDL